MWVITQFGVWFCGLSQSWDSDYADHYKVQIILIWYVMDFRFWFGELSQSSDSYFSNEFSDFTETQILWRGKKLSDKRKEREKEQLFGKNFLMNSAKQTI